MISFSIVSHNNIFEVMNLIENIIEHVHTNFQIIVTFNIPEDESILRKFKDRVNLKFIRNFKPLGYGVNNNNASIMAAGDFFIIVNPDVKILRFDYDKIFNKFCNENIGILGPVILNENKYVTNIYNHYPSFFKLILNFFNFNRNKLLYSNKLNFNKDVKWLSGAFMIFRTNTFRLNNGFDPRFFLYLEDVDICKRLYLKKLKLIYSSSVLVYHKGRRLSHKKFKYFFIHVNSYIKFLLKIY
jgi:N-acetylglucosaminyl-diphospho-decaprenol L-rhamnosyltransferase